MKEYDFDKDNEDFNLVQKFWYKDYMLYQNCGIDEGNYVGEYNGFTLFETEDVDGEDKLVERLHATLKGTKPLTVKEMKEKIIDYEKNLKPTLEEDEEDF